MFVYRKRKWERMVKMRFTHNHAERKGDGTLMLGILLQRKGWHLFTPCWLKNMSGIFDLWTESSN